MKVIFLDCDGVINSDLWFRNPCKRNFDDDPDIDPRCIDLINRLCDASGAKIVISSDWRYDIWCVKRLEKAGLKNIIDKNPIFDVDWYMGPIAPKRGDEINYWLETHPEVTQYCIIDDTNDFYDEQKTHFEKINPYHGFTMENLQNCLKLLSDDRREASERERSNPKQE